MTGDCAMSMFPLRARGTEPVRGSPREAGGNLSRLAVPHAGVDGQTRRVALTPFVSLSREAGEGDYGVRKQSFRPRNPLSHAVGEGLWVRANNAPLAHPVGEGLGVRAKRMYPTGARLGSPREVRDGTISSHTPPLVVNTHL